MSAGLNYFIEVARQGSIRGASERLNVAASAISRQVRLFEQEFGAPLLERTMRGVCLTAAGDAFLIYAKAVEAERNRARQTIDELNGLRRGHIRIASIDGVVAGPLSDIISDFRTRYPGITFDLRTMGTEAVTGDVHRGDSDIGIAFHYVSDAGVRIAHHMIDPLCAILGVGHSLADRERLSLSEALQVPLALPDTSFGIRRLIDSVCLARSMKPNIVLQTNSIEALRGYARSGAGMTMLPYLTSRREVELGTVRALLLDEPEFRNSSVDILVHAERPPTVAAAAFLEALCASIGVNSMFRSDPERYSPPGSAHARLHGRGQTGSNAVKKS